MKFKQEINEVHPSIKFDFNFSNKETLSFIKHNRESDRQVYLHRKSERLES